MSESKGGTDDVVTAEEAAQIKGVTRQAVYAAIRDGRLRSRQVGTGKAHLIQRIDLEQWHVIKNPPKRRRAEGSGT